MKFINKKSIYFGHEPRIFLSKKPFISYSYISVLFNESEFSPYGCTGISLDKKTAFKKALSESIDRRASMLYKLKFKEEFIEGFNIINKKIVSIPRLECCYNSSLENYIDTTGTAVHYQSYSAMHNSVFELLQKNSLFLFWYSDYGYIFEIDNEDIYFIEDSFYPIITLICINLQKNFVSIGLGTGLSIREAKTASENECYLIKTIINELSYKAENNLKMDEVEIEQHSSFHSSKVRKRIYEKINDYEYYKSGQKNYTFNEAINMLPKWLTNLNIIQIPQTIRNDLTCYKAHSSDLLMSAPKNTNINLSKNVNKKTINISTAELNKIPSLPII